MFEKIDKFRWTIWWSRSFCTVLIIWINLYFLTRSDSIFNNVNQHCFSELSGDVDDCGISVKETVKFNNIQLIPRLNYILKSNYFRYFKVNLQTKCPFWSNDGQCVLKDCHIKDCHSELPTDWLEDEDNVKEKVDSKCIDDNHGGLGTLDATLSKASKEAFQRWSHHDDNLLQFCEWEDDKSESSQYVDLLLNPERYTGYGYKDPAAWKIWHSIYNENCFNDVNKQSQAGKNVIPTASVPAQCLEIRTYHRLISGLHTSINLHLSYKYLLSNHMGVQKWGPNLNEFLRRFHPDNDPQGPLRLKNLYFAFLVELRALAKAAPLLRQEKFFTGSTRLDSELREQINSLLDVVEGFEHHFDESRLFKNDKSGVLKNEIRSKFLNVTRIMDCVGCDKCRLWGKLQVTGMGTALKLLFSPTLPDYLRRHEVVTLLNALGKLSESIHIVEEFKKLVAEHERKTEL